MPRKDGKPTAKEVRNRDAKRRYDYEALLRRVREAAGAEIVDQLITYVRALTYEEAALYDDSGMDAGDVAWWLESYADELWDEIDAAQSRAGTAAKGDGHG